MLTLQNFNLQRALQKPILLPPDANNDRVAWHYTPTANAQSIAETGYLRPQSAEDAARRNEGEWVFFSTANTITHGVNHQTHKANGCWMRFGVRASSLCMVCRPGESAIATRNTPLGDVLLKSRPNWQHVRWHASKEPVPLTDVAIIQATDDNGHTWRTIWVNPSAAETAKP